MFHLNPKRPLLFLLLVFLFSVTGSANSPKELKTLSGGKGILIHNHQSTVPFEFINKNIYVKAKINDSSREYSFILDTGAMNVISSRLAAELNLVKTGEITVSSVSGPSQEVNVMTLKSFQIGEATVRNCGVLIIDFQNLESNGLKADGIVGCSFLKFFKVKIDFERQLLTLSKKSETASELSGAYHFKLTHNSQGFVYVPLKPANSNSQYEAEIDTGAGNISMIIPSKYQNAFQVAMNCKPVISKGITSNGAFGGSGGALARLAEINLGGLSMNNVPVLFTDTSDILIGNDILSCFTIIIDYPKQDLFLIPIDAKKLKTNFYEFGFATQKEADGRIRITGIWEGSPADDNGLAAGDQIISMATETNAVLTFEELNRISSSDDVATLHLVIKNNNGVRKVVLQKAMLLPEI
jgi:predicted aspartyl protease